MSRGQGVGGMIGMGTHGNEETQLEVGLAGAEAARGVEVNGGGVLIDDQMDDAI